MNIRLLGIFWFISSLLVSSFNDVITKYLSNNISISQVVFLRFFFSTLTMIPFMLAKKKAFYTQVIWLHMLRGGLLFAGMLLWVLGLTVVKVSTATVINFTIPIFVLILARIFLKEKFSWVRFMATCFGFLGIGIVLDPSANDYNILALVLVLSALMFATLDVINKRFISHEGMLVMLFYSSFFTMSFSAIPAYYTWSMPVALDLVLFFILGIGANLILYCLLRAFAIVEASFVAPYRYLEFIFSAILGYVFFLEIPNDSTIIGTGVIIIATLVVVYEEFFMKVIRSIRKTKANG